MKLKIEVDLADVIENVDREYFCYDDFEKEVISSIKSSIIFETRQVILDKIKDATYSWQPWLSQAFLPCSFHLILRSS